MELSDFKEAVESNDAILEAGHVALGKFLARKEFYSATENGSVGLKREGQKRQVHYVELDDDSGSILRIEIYLKSKA